MRVLRLPRPIEIGAVLLFAAVAAAPLAAPREAAGRRGWLGFSFGSSAFTYVVPGPEHVSTDRAPVVVGEVLKGSPADRAGLEPGDTLLSVNGKRATIEGVQQAARQLHPGDTVRLEVRRAGRTQTLTLHAAERPQYLAWESFPERFVYGPMTINIAGDSIRRFMRVFMDSARTQMDSMHLPQFRLQRHDSVLIFQPHGGKPDTIWMRHGDMPGMMRIRVGADSALLGLQDNLLTLQHEGIPGFGVEVNARRAIAGAAVQELNEQLASYFGVREGLLVERVTAGTPAARAGLQAGDVVTAAAGRPVGDIADLRRALRGREGTVKLDIVRKGKAQSVSIKWP